MKVIIAGIRTLENYEAVKAAVRKSGFEIEEVVSGCANGADKLGEKWAFENGLPIKRFPADWDRNGKAAGPIRNRKMAEYADALIAIWDDMSPGTRNMIHEARKRGLKVHVHIVG